MFSMTDEHRARVAELCRKYEVRVLKLFGSAARGDFRVDTSDLDFLVAFHWAGVVRPQNRYFGLLADLEDLFGRRIDLAMVGAHRNPYFMAEALKRRVRVYAA